MYERFTDRARKVIQLANQEAQRFNHEYIDTEHILLGLVKEGSGVAGLILKNLEVDLKKIRSEVEKIIQSGLDMVTMGKLSYTPRTKKVIEYAIEEARNLDYNYVGTEHLLLGLLCEQEGVAAQVLMHLGLTLESVRIKISKPLESKQKSEVSIKTMASELVDCSKKHVRLAIQNLAEVVISETYGYEEYNADYRERLDDAFNKLREVREILR